ncbi:MAG TPA: hypothetical protein VNT32_06750, partial [Thermoleophilaceae bacterium]|nr:hypothetical protein [Thermoleophilaceae bacterium]
MSSILLVTGGVGFARQVFEGERRGYWSQALPLVLEKYGYLGVATAGPEALEDERTWQANAAVLVARMPEGAWSGRALERMRGGRAQALIELPPPQLEEMLGVSGSAADAAGAVSPVDEELRARVGELTPVLSTRLQPPQVRPVERSPETDWQRLDVPIDGGQAEAWRALGW